MKLNGIVRNACGLLFAAAVSVPAQAAYVVLDGWRLVTPSATTSNIGRLNLSSGTATIEQEINGFGQVFVGARFAETGQIFTITYTPENVIGAGDSGAPALLGEFLKIRFSDVKGEVTGLNGTGFSYNFSSGDYNFRNFADTTTYASGTVVGLGGNASSTSVIGGFNGDSTLLTNILSSVAGFDIRDSLNNSLLTQLSTGDILFQAVTNNFLAGAPPTAGACSFDAGATCLTFTAGSGGDAFLVRNIVEPGSLALFGVALAGLALGGRRRFGTA